MRIAMVSDQHTGGASIAAERLAQGLRARRMTVVRFASGRSWLPAGSRRYGPGPLRWIFTGALRRIGAPVLGRRLRRVGAVRSLAARLAAFDPQVINLHNLHGLFDDPLALAPLCAGRALIWNLHDMASFTGRCFHAYDCDLFLTGCDARCPTPTAYPAQRPSAIRASWKRRGAFLRKLPGATAVSPSEWLARSARQGLWRDHAVKVIPHGLRLDVFCPAARRSEARRALGVAPGDVVLGFGAEDPADPVKGASHLYPAIRSLRDPQLRLITFGKRPPRGKISELRHTHLGTIRDNADLARVYAAFDLFVYPSLAETFGQVLQESVACGTPCVAFAVGGIPEIVRPGITGWLSKEVSDAGLGHALAEALRSLEEGVDLRQSCREVAEREYGLELQAERYQRLFEESGAWCPTPRGAGAGVP